MQCSVYVTVHLLAFLASAGRCFKSSRTMCQAIYLSFDFDNGSPERSPGFFNTPYIIEFESYIFPVS